MRTARGLEIFLKKYLSQAATTEIFESASLEWNKALPYEKIPGPRALPLVGNTWRFLPYVGGFDIEHIDKVCIKLHKKYGKIVKLEGLWGRPDMLFLFDPDLIERVFRQEDSMPYRPSMPSLSYYKHEYKKDVFGENGGVIAVHGEDWQKFRSKVNQFMLQPGAVNQYIGTISEACDQFIERIEHLKNNAEEVPEDFLNEIHKWSLESLARIALDIKLNCLAEQPEEHAQLLIDAVNTFFMGVPILELKYPFWRIIKTRTFENYISALDTIHELCNEHIQRAVKKSTLKASEPDSSVLQKVLRTHDAKTASNLALDMFLVGIDTTSNAVASVLYQLAIHQDVQEELFKKLITDIPDIDSGIKVNDLQKMSYLKACIKETMRMFPVVIGNGRCTTNNYVIGGYQVPKGVIFQHYVLSNLDEYFPKSAKFLPERWLSKDENRTRHNFASLPFGYGRRMCLGRRFADLEMQILIAKVVANYRIEFNHTKLDYHIHPMYTPNGPLRFKFEKRRKY